MIRKVSKVGLAGVLALAIVIVGCSAAAIQAYITLAANIALQVAVLVGAPQAKADVVSADLAVAQKLFTDLRNAKASAQPGIVAQLDAELTAAQGDLSAILAAAQIKDPNKIKAANAGLAIAIVAVESLRAEMLKGAPSPVVVAVKAALPGIVIPKSSVASPKQLKALYNSAVASYPQAAIK